MIFKETQKFRQPWIWIILISLGLIVITIFGIGFYTQIIQGQKFGNNPMSDTELIIVSSASIVLIILICLLIGSAKLITVINKDRIEYRFFPLHFRNHKIEWNEVENYEVVKYHPIRDYGGWGIRYGFKGKAFNVSGNKGLQLYLKNGKKILIGTQRESELSEFLNKLFRVGIT
jgi:hypothetical protein